MKKYLFIVLLVGVCFGQDNPCEDKRYLKIKEKALDDMSDREYDYFNKVDAECKKFSQVKSFNNVEVQKKSPRIKINTEGFLSNIKSKYPAVNCEICGLPMRETIKGFVCVDQHMRIEKSDFQLDKNRNYYLLSKDMRGQKQKDMDLISLIVVGGYNMSRVKYNDDDFAELVDVDWKNGLHIGLEIRSSNIIAGASFLQRGAKIKAEIDSYTMEGYDIYNYFALHALRKVSMGRGLDGFGGIQLSFPLGGETKLKAFGESEIKDIDIDKIAPDFGLLIGVNYMLNGLFGLRASYHLGLTNVAVESEDNENYKNNTIALSILMKL